MMKASLFLSLFIFSFASFVSAQEDLEETSEEEDSRGFVPATLSSTTTSQDVAPDGDAGYRDLQNRSPDSVSYLWDYVGLQADFANFRHHSIGVKLNLGPHSAFSTSAVYNFLLRDAINVHAEAGIGTIIGEIDGEKSSIVAGPGMHAQIFVGFPFTDWRGHNVTTVHIGDSRTGPNTLSAGVPSHRRFIFEAGLLHSTVNFELTQRNTSPAFGFRWMVDWNFRTEDVMDRFEGIWWVALHAVPTTWADRGGEVGGGFNVDVSVPFSNSRTDPTLLNVGGSFLPDGSWTAQAGLVFFFAHL